MPTTLFVQQQHRLYPLDEHDGGDDGALHLLPHPKQLHILSEHDYVRSLIPSAAQRAARVRTHDRSSSRPIIPRGLVRTDRTAPRPLMATMTFPLPAATSLEGAPGSPPDLTNSKSSKSSSLHSASFSDIMGPGDLSHFEDINLDDLKVPRASISSVTSSRSTPQVPTHSFRDLTGSKPRFPSLKSQVNVAAHQQNAGLGLSAPSKSSRRGLTSPSAPSLPNMSSLGPSGRRSPSPSPSRTPKMPPAPRSLSRRRSSSRNLDPGMSSSSMNPRRQSWQHTARKTVKELEAECDADDDDELPEDAIIMNVPISPRPAQERSAPPSACNSPPSTVASPVPSRPASQRGDSASDVPSPSALSEPAPRASSQPPSPDPSSETISPLPTQFLTRQRTHTWEDTYTHLDGDAKKLTEALEEFQSEFERKEEVKRQQPGLSRSTSVDQPKSLNKSKTNSLPPLRRNDPLIDPFQPSKEKEKYLSRTRPSWLPPKNKKEEKKHLKEILEIQARIEKDLRQEQDREEKRRAAREQEEIVKARILEGLLSHWDQEIKDPSRKMENRKLWWLGIPSLNRTAVWQRAIDNDLKVTQETFNHALTNATKAVNEPKSPSAQEFEEDGFGGVQNRPSADYAQLPVIVSNVSETFPGHGFRIGEPHYPDLFDICLAYTAFRPDVGTPKCISHVAGLFYLAGMDKISTFRSLCNFFDRELPLAFLINDHEGMRKSYDLMRDCLNKKASMSALVQHFKELGIEPHMYVDNMYRSMFCDRLPLEHAARVMDIYAMEEDKIPTRVAIGLLKVLEGRLLQAKDAKSVLEIINKPQAEWLPSADDFITAVFVAGKED